MILGIDASNIRAGGGTTHLIELLKAADPTNFGISKIIIWSVQKTLERIEDRPWLVKICPPLLNKTAFHRSYWQFFCLKNAAKSHNCDSIFIPGGNFIGSYRRVITMSQNLLPFQLFELQRNGISWTTVRFLLLRLLQIRSFRKSDGIIFLTNYARNVIIQTIKKTKGKVTTIPHGINNLFFNMPKTQRTIQEYSFDNPFQIIYVSTINVYKHQWHVVESIKILRNSGLPVSLVLIGPATRNSFKRLHHSLSEIDPENKFIHYIGQIPYKDMPLYYNKSDLCLFASSCENLPIILLEGMASGLPVTCSDKGPMPEILGDSGIYFNPEDPYDIARKLEQLILQPDLRFTLSCKSYQKAKQYTWKRCADETFNFIKNVNA